MAIGLWQGYQPAFQNCNLYQKVVSSLCRGSKVEWPLFLDWYHKGISQQDTAMLKMIFLIVFQGRLRYEATGIYPAESFFSIDPDNGDIRVYRSLKEDGLNRQSYSVSDMYSIVCL